MRLLGAAGVILGLSWGAAATPAMSTESGWAQGSGTEAAVALLDARSLEANMRYLAGDELEGRAAATPGFAKAAKFMAGQFRGLGLTPAGADGDYFQKVPLADAVLERDSGRLTLTDEKGERALVWAEDFVLSGDVMRSAAKVTAPVAFVGFGVSAPELGYDDYADIEVTGKIVAYLMNSPERFANDQRAFYASGRNKRINAAAHGAVGVLVLMSPEVEKRRPWARTVRLSARPVMRWRDQAGQPHEWPTRIKGAATLSQQGAAQLFAEAPISLARIFTAAKLGRPPAFDLPVSVTIEHASRRRQVESVNVAGFLPGADPALADQYVVFLAHLDHLGRGRPVDGDSIYNGAYDNASGSAILLEIARAFAGAPDAFRRSVLFLAVTAEEQGLLGSDFYVNHPTVPITDIAAAINIDMVHMFHPLHDFVAWGENHSSLAETVHAVARQMGLTVQPDPFPERVVFLRSDHYSFVRQGVPALSMFPAFRTGDKNTDGREMFRNWMARSYHAPSDDMSQDFNFHAGLRFAELNVRVGMAVANKTDRPVWNDGDFFAAKFARP